MRQFSHGHFVNFDAFGTEFAGDGIAQSALGVVIFNRDDHVVGFICGGLDDVFPQGFDRICVYHRDSNTF
jgi:hypothetical protein